MTSVSVAAYGSRSTDGRDTVLRVAAALEDVRRTGARKLVFPPGRYEFRPDLAAERYIFVSNNEPSLKRIAFDLQGIHDLEIDGQGSEFIFNGFITPFVLEKTRNITLRNFSVDWARPFHSEGTIEAVHGDGVDLSFSSKYPYRVEHGILLFTDEQGVKYPYVMMLEFDIHKRETAFQVPDYWTGTTLQAQELKPGLVRILRPGITGTVGNTFVFGPNNRQCSAIVVADAVNTVIQDVTLHHCGGMGVIAQRSHDVTIERMRVTPTPESGRIVSLSADATHFVNCTGSILLSECLFENQKDDATNIHGIYTRVSTVLSNHEVEVQLVHQDQFGFDYLKPGMHVELAHGPSLITYGEAVVKSVTRLNKEYTRFTVESPLPSGLMAGDVVASVNGYPDVLIRKCIIRNNRARGILLGSRGKIVVEDNLFHTPGAAILLEGDGCYWFEQAGVRDLTIRRNRFENCNYGIWGNACIQVAPGIAESGRDKSRYNRNILIEDNTFRAFDPRLVSAYCVDGLTVRNNRIERTTDYPAPPGDNQPFNITHSDHVTVDR